MFIFCFLVACARGRNVVVRDAVSLANACDNAQPGDAIVITGELNGRCELFGNRDVLLRTSISSPQLTRVTEDISSRANWTSCMNELWLKAVLLVITVFLYFFLFRLRQPKASCRPFFSIHAQTSLSSLW